MNATLNTARPTVQIAYGPTPAAPKAPKPRKVQDAPSGLEFDRMFDAGRIVWDGDIATWR